MSSLYLTHTRKSHRDIQEHKLFSAALKFDQLISLIVQELHYLSQQQTGNIIFSKGIEAPASLLIK